MAKVIYDFEYIEKAIRKLGKIKGLDISDALNILKNVEVDYDNKIYSLEYNVTNLENEVFDLESQISDLESEISNRDLENKAFSRELEE